MSEALGAGGGEEAFLPPCQDMMTRLMEDSSGYAVQTNYVSTMEKYKTNVIEIWRGNQTCEQLILIVGSTVYKLKGRCMSNT